MHNRTSSPDPERELEHIIANMPERNQPIPDRIQRIIGDRGFLRSYLDLLGGRNETSSLFHLATALTVLGGGLARKVYVRHGERRVYPNCFTLVVGNSGISRKSSALSPGKRVFSNSGTGDTMPDNFSEEALAEILKEAPVLGIISEFKTLVMNAGKNYAGGLISRLTDLFDMPAELSFAFKKNAKRKGEGCKVVVPDPTLSLIAATTEDYFAVDDADVAGGFVGRFLVFAHQEETPVIPWPAPIPKEAFVHLGAMLRERAENGCGELELTAEAKDAFSDIYRRFRKEASEAPDRSAAMDSFRSRAGLFVLKLSLIFAVSENPHAKVIEKTHITRAELLVKQCTEGHARLISRICTSKWEKDRKKAQDFIAARSETSMRDIYRHLGVDVQTAGRIVDTLEASGLVHSRMEKAANGKEVVRIVNGPDPEESAA